MQATQPGVGVLLGRADFRRLLGTRLLSQFGDGVFQAALAGTVLFNPQRAADPVDIAAGFAVLLLPYSLVGPFAGVWLDRWSRRQVLLWANVARSAFVTVVAALTFAGVEGTAFFLAGLAVFSVNRFILAALSAALPHTVDQPSLVSANALSTTSGTVLTVAGGATAVAFLQVSGAGDVAYAATTLGAVLPYLAAAGVVAGFSRPYLGPDHPGRSLRLPVREVAAGMVAGARHAWARPAAVAVLTAITLHRVCYALLTLMTLLLFRNSFEEGGPVPAGLPGLGLVIAAAGAGTVLGAAVTPRAVRRSGKRRWITLVLAGAGIVLPLLVALFLPPAVVLAGLVLGFVGQAVKICVDSTLQETIESDFRGRVFAVYDTLVNVSFVAATVAAALTLPPSGISPAMLLAVAAGYALAAGVHARMTSAR